MRLHLFLTPAAALLLVACERPQPARRDSASTAPASAATRESAQLAGRPAGASASVVATTGARPSMPKVIEGFCQGESCESEYPALACAPVELRSIAADTAPVVARIQRGDTVRVRRRDLHVLEPGRVVVRRDFDLEWEYDMEGGRFQREDPVHFAAGDTVYLLHYLQLGWWVWWHRGRETSGGEFWTGPDGGEFGGATSLSDSSSAVAVGLSHPRTADWWQVEPRSGQAGWWRADTLYSLMPMGTRMGLGACPTW